MWVTCYTDASYSTRNGGGWAVWLRSELGRVVERGRCPSYVRDSNVAELAAIYAGVYLATATWGQAVTGILVRSDSQGALLLADPAAPLARDPAANRLQQKIREILACGIYLRCKWVKGHQPRTRGTAAYLNAQCDKLASQGRRLSRRKHHR